MSLRMRRGGGTVSPPPPPSEVFGPVNGAQAVRDGAGARTVNSPGGGVTFTAASNINSLISANSANTVFVASSSSGSTFSNFRNVSVQSKHPRFYFPGAVGTFIIQGAGTLNEMGIDGTGGFEVYGGTWQGYGTQSNDATSRCMNVLGPSSGTSNTIIQDAVFQNNRQLGVGVYRYTAHQHFTCTISHCSFISNGRYAYSGSAEGIQSDTAIGAYTPIIEYNMVTNSNTFGRAGDPNYNPGGNAGVQKFGYSGNGIFRYNWYHDNYGFGFWFDGYNRMATLNDNVGENNLMELFYEISRGGTIFEHNYCRYDPVDTGTGYPFNTTMVTISCSPSDGTGPSAVYNAQTQIRYNDIDPAGGGTATPVVLYNHGCHPSAERTRNTYVHHNRIWLRGVSGTGRVGLADACDSSNPVGCSSGSAKQGDIGTSPGLPGLNLFDYNEYHVADMGGSYWEHDTSRLSPGVLSWTAFQSRGHEAHGLRVAV